MIKFKKYAFVGITVSIIIVSALKISLADKPLLVLDNKSILKLLIKNDDVLLKDAAHCNGVGTDETDKTIGDYISGFWVMHSEKQGQNWLEIKLDNISQDKRLAKVLIYRKNGEENWGWGVSFEINKTNNINRSSFTCLGSG